MSRIGYGYTSQEVVNLAPDYVVSVGKREDSDTSFSSSWWTGFKRWHNDLTIFKPQKLSMIRAKNTSQETLDQYFEELDKVFKKYDLEAHP